jgi:hypothetical protein
MSALPCRSPHPLTPSAGSKAPSSIIPSRTHVRRPVSEAERGHRGGAQTSRAGKLTTNQKRVSFVDVIRKQVQPVSLHTR